MYRNQKAGPSGEWVVILLLALLLMILMFSAPDAAQAQEAPVGYWSLTTPATNVNTGEDIQVSVLVHFKPDHSFAAVLKTYDGHATVGSGGIFTGVWQLREAFEHTMVCVRRSSAGSGVCQYTIEQDTVGGGPPELWYLDRPLMRQTEASVKAIAPELVTP